MQKKFCSEMVPAEDRVLSILHGRVRLDRWGHTEDSFLPLSLFLFLSLSLPDISDSPCSPLLLPLSLTLHGSLPRSLSCLLRVACPSLRLPCMLLVSWVSLLPAIAQELAGRFYTARADLTLEGAYRGRSVVFVSPKRGILHATGCGSVLGCNGSGFSGLLLVCCKGSGSALSEKARQSEYSGNPLTKTWPESTRSKNSPSTTIFLS